MTLSWYRSWPAPQEFAERNLEERPHVIDGIPKLLITQQNYRDAPWPQDTPGFCMLEWDIALDPVAQRMFAAEALIRPNEVLVASYRFHDTEALWVGNKGEGPTVESRPVYGGCPMCGEDRTDSFGLGCIYIPQAALQKFLAVMDHIGFTDYTFGRWYHEHYGQARVTWRVHPQHLHDYEGERADGTA
jgi:hypothetical protein